MRIKIVKYPVEAMAIFIWIGFVCAISFMEAWVKFRAPNVTLPIGLSIGRVVFSGLNKVEWILAAVVTGTFVLRKIRPSFFQLVFFSIPVAILIIQTFFLFPILFERIDIILSGQKPMTSHVHFYYLFLEVLKVISLFVFGVFCFDSTIAYQGAARGLGMGKVADCCAFMSQGLEPHLTIYLDIDPAIGLQRVQRSRNQDRIELETLAFHTKIREAFRSFHQQFPHRVHLIDATQAPAKVFEDAMFFIHTLVSKYHV